MHKKRLFVVMAIMSLLFINVRDIHSQSPDADGRRFEVGGQFSLLNISNARSISTTTNPCLVPPCPSSATIEYAREATPGFGGRIGYNITNYFAVEAETNFFPRTRGDGSGREFEGLFGVKAGWRSEKIGIFGKARPGFFSGRVSDFRPKSGIVCAAVFPPPAGCFEEIRRRETNAALDVGGVVELYPTGRTIVRFDAGDTILRFGGRNIKAPSTAFPQGVIVAVPADTTHNFQGSFGIGYRF